MSRLSTFKLFSGSSTKSKERPPPPPPPKDPLYLATLRNGSSSALSVVSTVPKTGSSGNGRYVGNGPAAASSSALSLSSPPPLPTTDHAFSAKIGRWGRKSKKQKNKKQFEPEIQDEGEFEQVDFPPDESISMPWNFQHHVHVDEGYTGLPPTWHARLTSAGFSSEEIHSIQTRRAPLPSILTSSAAPSLRSEQSQPPSPVNIPSPIVKPHPRNSSLPRKFSDASLKSYLSNGSFKDSPPPVPSLPSHHHTHSTNSSISSFGSARARGAPAVNPPPTSAPSSPSIHPSIGTPIHNGNPSPMNPRGRSPQPRKLVVANMPTPTPAPAVSGGLGVRNRHKQPSIDSEFTSESASSGSHSHSHSQSHSTSSHNHPPTTTTPRTQASGPQLALLGSSLLKRPPRLSIYSGVLNGETVEDWSQSLLNSAMSVDELGKEKEFDLTRRGNTAHNNQALDDDDDEDERNERRDTIVPHGSATSRNRDTIVPHNHNNHNNSRDTIVLTNGKRDTVVPSSIHEKSNNKPTLHLLDVSRGSSPTSRYSDDSDSEDDDDEEEEEEDMGRRGKEIHPKKGMEPPMSAVTPPSSTVVASQAMKGLAHVLMAGDKKGIVEEDEGEDDHNLTSPQSLGSSTFSASSSSTTGSGYSNGSSSSSVVVTMKGRGRGDPFSRPSTRQNQSPWTNGGGGNTEASSSTTTITSPVHVSSSSPSSTSTSISTSSTATATSRAKSPASVPPPPPPPPTRSPPDPPPPLSYTSISQRPPATTTTSGSNSSTITLQQTRPTHKPHSSSLSAVGGAPISDHHQQNGSGYGYGQHRRSGSSSSGNSGSGRMSSRHVPPPPKRPMPSGPPPPLPVLPALPGPNKQGGEGEQGEDEEREEGEESPPPVVVVPVSVPVGVTGKKVPPPLPLGSPSSRSSIGDGAFGTGTGTGTGTGIGIGHGLSGIDSARSPLWAELVNLVQPPTPVGGGDDDDESDYGEDEDEDDDDDEGGELVTPGSSDGCGGVVVGGRRVVKDDSVRKRNGTNTTSNTNNNSRKDVPNPNPTNNNNNNSNNRNAPNVLSPALVEFYSPTLPLSPGGLARHDRLIRDPQGAAAISQLLTSSSSSSSQQQQQQAQVSPGTLERQREFDRAWDGVVSVDSSPLGDQEKEEVVEEDGERKGGRKRSEDDRAISFSSYYGGMYSANNSNNNTTTTMGTSHLHPPQPLGAPPPQPHSLSVSDKQLPPSPRDSGGSFNSSFGSVEMMEIEQRDVIIVRGERRNLGLGLGGSVRAGLVGAGVGGSRSTSVGSGGGRVVGGRSRSGSRTHSRSSSLSGEVGVGVGLGLGLGMGVGLGIGRVDDASGNGTSEREGVVDDGDVKGDGVARVSDDDEDDDDVYDDDDMVGGGRGGWLSAITEKASDWDGDVDVDRDRDMDRDSVEERDSAILYYLRDGSPLVSPVPGVIQQQQQEEEEEDDDNDTDMEEEGAVLLHPPQAQQHISTTTMASSKPEFLTIPRPQIRISTPAIPSPPANVTHVPVPSTQPHALRQQQQYSPDSIYTPQSAMMMNSAGTLSSPRYTGWLNQVLKPLDEWIEKEIDPREYYVSLTEIAEGESGLVNIALLDPRLGESLAEEPLSQHQEMGGSLSLKGGQFGKIGMLTQLSALKKAEDVDCLNRGVERAVAIKVVPILPAPTTATTPPPEPSSTSPSAQQKKIATLAHELNLLRNLSHVNILVIDSVYVDTYDFDYALWIRMELMERSLADVIGLVPEGLMVLERMIARFTGDLLAGLEYLHERGIVHRDVRSDNLLIDNQGVLKLSDFSQAIHLQPSAAMISSTAGVIYWQPPEVRMFDLHPYDAFKVDSYSVGATVWEMASGDGNPPWADDPDQAKEAMGYPEMSDERKRVYSPAFWDFLKMCQREWRERPGVKELRKTQFAQNASGRPVIIQLLSQAVNIEKTLNELALEEEEEGE